MSFDRILETCALCWSYAQEICRASVKRVGYVLTVVVSQEANFSIDWYLLVDTRRIQALVTVEVICSACMRQEAKAACVVQEILEAGDFYST